MKYLLVLVSMLSSLCLYAQEDKIYKSMEEALKNPEKVFHLDLSGQGLTTSPKSLKKFVNLQSLNLSNNKLTKLPELGVFTSLHSVDLSNNNLIYLPNDLNISGGDRNLIINNNPSSVIAVSKSTQSKITEIGFEGTIRLASSAKIVSETKNDQTFLKVLPYGPSYATWIEIHKKGSKTNEGILNELRDYKFNYFIDKQLTYDNSLDSLPAFARYSSILLAKKRINSYNFVVFYDKYYITLSGEYGASGHKINEGDMSQLLQYALTYKPKLNNEIQFELVNGIDFSKDEFKTKSAEDFLAKATMPEKVKVATVLPVLTPVSETIYTLQPGETVAFTDEYKLGVYLKSDEYFIYYKKAGKYYVKTDNKVFGPYDNIPDDEFGWGYDDNVIPIKPILNNKAYFIFDGEEFGPFSQDAELWISVNKDGSISKDLSYNTDSSSFYEKNGRKYGPFPLNSSLEILNGKEIVFSGSGNGTKDLIIDGEVVLSNFNILGYGNQINGEHLCFAYSKDGKQYARFDDKSFGPYDEVLEVDVVDDQFRMSYKDLNKVFKLIDGKTFGPFDEFTSNFQTLDDNFFTYKNDGKYYASIDGISNGPYDKMPYVVSIYDDLYREYIYYLWYAKNGKEYFLFKGKNYGPFENIFGMRSDYLSKEVISLDDKEPFTLVKNTDGTFSVFTPEENYLSFKTCPYVYYSDSLKRIAFSFSERNDEGYEEDFLWIDGLKYGPFDQIIPINETNNYPFYEYRFILTTLSGKKMVVDEDGIFGTFDKMQMQGSSSDDYAECKMGDQWFIFENKKLLGPIMNIPPDDPNDYEDESKYFWKDGPNIVVAKDNSGNSGHYINGQLSNLGNEYMLASNNRNYMSIIRNDNYEVTGYVINNKHTKSKDFIYNKWEEETKTLYWLTLEGRNIVRYTLKL